MICTNFTLKIQSGINIWKTPSHLYSFNNALPRQAVCTFGNWLWRLFQRARTLSLKAWIPMIYRPPMYTSSAYQFSSSSQLLVQTIQAGIQTADCSFCWTLEYIFQFECRAKYMNAWTHTHTHFQTHIIWSNLNCITNTPTGNSCSEKTISIMV